MRSQRLFLLLAFLLAGCGPSPQVPIVEREASGTNSPSEASQPESKATQWSTAIATQGDEGDQCQMPSSDYSVVAVNSFQLNQRTLDMLFYAQDLYAGRIDVAGEAITQGSFTDEEAGSFSTHAGGGALDISVYDKSGSTWKLLEEDIEPLIFALRTAGFAAWYRPSDYLREGSAAHIHAIAIGDVTLSKEAQQQVDGQCGYFRGLSGLPIKENECKAKLDPRPDLHGGPTVCEWMCGLGYESLANDLRCTKEGRE